MGAIVGNKETYYIAGHLGVPGFRESSHEWHRGSVMRLQLPQPQLNCENLIEK